MTNYLYLEALPNEIFEELFEYFEIDELFTTFFRLNYRFDALVRSFGHLQVILCSPDDLERSINRCLLPTTKILIVDHSKHLYDPDQIASLSHIRCLILCQPTRQQWNAIDSQCFPHLERLHLISSKFVFRTEQLCQRVFSNEFRSLHACSLPYISYDVDNNWTGSPNLRSLRVNIWDIAGYVRILRACPNLDRLKIQLSGVSSTNELVTDKPMKHSALRHLALCCSKAITCEFIDSVLAFAPDLRRFSLKMYFHRSSDVFMHTLASTLQRRTPKLDQTYIDITFMNELFCPQHIETSYPLFSSWELRRELNKPTRLMIRGQLPP